MSSPAADVSSLLTCRHRRRVVTADVSSPPTCRHRRRVVTADVSSPPTLSANRVIHTNRFPRSVSRAFIATKRKPPPPPPPPWLGGGGEDVGAKTERQARIHRGCCCRCRLLAREMYRSDTVAKDCITR